MAATDRQTNVENSAIIQIYLKKNPTVYQLMLAYGQTDPRLYVKGVPFVIIRNETVVRERHVTAR